MPVLNGEYIPAVVTDRNGSFKETVYRPHVWFMFKIGHRLTKPVAGLIDSGADRNLFPADVGKKLGLNVKKGEENDVRGIDNKLMTTYRHKNTELLFDQGYHYKTEIDFSYGMQILLFGGIGFFDKFKRVTLNKIDEIVELEY